MRKIAFLLVLAFVVLAFTVSADAQHRYLGAGGARVLQCANFYSSLDAQLLCVRGDELSAGQIERLGLVDRNSQIGQWYGYGGNYGYNGGDGYFYPTNASGRPTGTRERIVTGGAIGAGAGYAIFGNTRGTVGGAVVGAVIGAISGSKANNRNKKEVQIRETNFRAAEAQKAQTEQSLAEAQAVQVETASKEQKLLRNRFDAFVRVISRYPDGRIEETVLNPGETLKINPPRGSQLVLAEVETETGEWIRLEYGSGKIRLPYNSGWEFDPGSGS